MFSFTNEILVVHISPHLLISHWREKFPSGLSILWSRLQTDAETDLPLEAIPDVRYTLAITVSVDVTDAKDIVSADLTTDPIWK